MTADGYALLVVDMQNGFCHPDGSFPQDRPRPRRRDGRRAGRRGRGRPGSARRDPRGVHQARVPAGPPRRGRGADQQQPGAGRGHGLAVGTWDAEVCDELGCGPGDLVVDKVRFDAFQWTSLEPLLRGLGVTKLMICGVVTNICVETTARSAFMRDFPVTLLADCCAAKTRRLHELSIEVLSSYELAEIASITAASTPATRAPPRAACPPRCSPLPSGAASLAAASLASSRQPSRNRPRNASATTMNASGGALAGDDPQDHAERHGAQPDGDPGGAQRQRAAPGAARPASRRPARQERPGGRGDAGDRLALGVAGAADDHEDEHAAHVEDQRHPRGPSRTHAGKGIPGPERGRCDIHHARVWTMRHRPRCE